METMTQALTLITQGLLAGNTAIPIIFGTITSIAAIIRGAGGQGPSPTELAELIERQIAQNDTNGRAEIARLKTMVSG